MEPASLENLSVLYQSTNYIVVNKHWDIRIDSKMWYEKQTVQSQLKHHFPELADPGTYYGFRFCHQLDFSTSGALCVALNKAAAGQAYRCFKDRRVTKAYLALVRGTVTEENLSLDFAIGKNTTEGKTHMMCTEGTEGCENPKPCQTEVTVLEYGTYDGDQVTKVLLQPLTGRTHQLRVHCSAIGHPIVGDYTYSLRTDNSPYRMMLHAYFLHIPLHNEPIHVTAPDPFVPSLDAKWAPLRCVNILEDLLKNILTKLQAAMQEEAEPEPRTSSPVESEEQRAQCQQWLCEWSLE
ncbi:RNA pseudouridylate synthase domain-containing protein 1 [Danio rerio]|uniref:RNA pseudouridylate synthase domain-containing protein 1 n=1 Tax=Danio rerio TaxID=7955 RepID=RUSD1_DANRE|nr:RNA pseudouridylate synthase domain-containing protein 1 [Danio rerio]Q08C69.1 RecName: Full=RNA pseudouridylate synthase domain-containing protein 1 [Danio rerio]AAI24363.1 Zgc:153465 [Danio rerio]|eukprot:NP_001070221.1 RNA pseudouridylate synthase domain-containing protein 1 [Danio rerio]